MDESSVRSSPAHSRLSIPAQGPRSLLTVSLILVTELIKWLVIIGAIYLGTWQFCELTDEVLPANTTASPSASYYSMCQFGAGTSLAKFWGVFTGIVLGISILFYLPFRLVAIRIRFKRYVFRDGKWRPAILIYIMLAAVPSFALILAATQIGNPQTDTMDPKTVTALQMIIMGLVVTEWMAKIQQEHITYDLLSEMAIDFFFAYDCIAFVSLAAKPEIFYSDWIYPAFILAVVSMLKYLPTDPTDLPDYGVSWGHVVHVIVTLSCNDIPFVVIRMSTMIIFRTFLISDMIFLMKNWFVIIFSCIKLGIIFYNAKRPPETSFPKKRQFRGPEVWCDPKDGVCHVRVGDINSELSPRNKTRMAEND